MKTILSLLLASFGFSAFGQLVYVTARNGAVSQPTTFWPSNRLAILASLDLDLPINGGFPNGTGALVDWSRLTGVPAGFADGSDDGSAGASGTVTSIGMASTVLGLGWSGLPITTSGTGTLTGIVAVASGGTGATTAAGARAALSLVPGTDVQVYDSDLAALAGNNGAFLTGLNAAAIATGFVPVARMDPSMATDGEVAAAYQGLSPNLSSLSTNGFTGTGAFVRADSPTLSGLWSFGSLYATTLSTSNLYLTPIAYGAGWDGSSNAVTADAVWDKIETLATIASPALTGNPTVPTASPGDNDTTAASTAFVAAAVAAGGGGVGSSIQVDAVSGVSNLLSGVGVSLTKTGGTAAPLLVNSSLNPANVRLTPYLATGDGTTDDTAAIQAAMRSNSVVYIPAGTYLIDPVYFTNVVVYGDGDATVLKMKSPDAVADRYLLNGLVGINQVRDLLLDGNSSTNYNAATAGYRYGLGLYSAGRALARGVSARNFSAAGIKLTGDSSISTRMNEARIHGCSVSNSYFGIWVSTTCEYVKVENNVAKKCYSGLRNDTANVSIVGNNFSDNTWNVDVGGTTVSSRTHSVYTGNTLNHGSVRISYGSSGSTFAGNHLLGTVTVLMTNYTRNVSFRANFFETATFADTHGTNFVAGNTFLGTLTRTAAPDTRFSENYSTDGTRIADALDSSLALKEPLATQVELQPFLTVTNYVLDPTAGAYQIINATNLVTRFLHATNISASKRCVFLVLSGTNASVSVELPSNVKVANTNKFSMGPNQVLPISLYGYGADNTNALVTLGKAGL